MSRAEAAGAGRPRTVTDDPAVLEPQLLTVEQAATVLGIGRTEAYELISTGC